jgi:hypothetical protein
VKEKGIINAMMTKEIEKRLMASSAILRFILRRIWVFVLIFSFCAGALFCACRRPDPEVGAARKPIPGIHKSYVRGPATCLLDVNKSEITTADRLKLVITVITDPAYEAEIPSLGATLDRFTIEEDHTPAPELTADSRTKISRSYVLEPFLPGEYTLPAMTIHFWKSGQRTRKIRDITTEALSIKVNSLLPKNPGTIKLHDIQPPVALSAGFSSWMWMAGGGLLIAVFAAIFWIHHRRGRNEATKPPDIAPHDLAYGELEALVGRHLIELGQIKQFYREISNILRRYIENRFGIKAAELTTEEFLEGLKTHKTFPTQYRPLLKKFLKHCDLVKFADHHPSAEDIRNTYDSCRKFIAETALRTADDSGTEVA